MTLLDILLLYLAFRVKQVTCDFFLQTSWMALTKGNPLKEGGGRALMAHAGVHGAGTLIVALIFWKPFWWLAIVDFAVHAGIDKLKAKINKSHGWTYKDAAYWWAFGLDQEAHNLTHLGYIVLMVQAAGVSLRG
jgi:Protein of unknown function (DUF3307)